MPVLFAWMMTIRKPGGWISILLISTFDSLVNGYKLDYVIMQFTIMTCREKNKIVSRSVLKKIFHRLSVFKFYSSELVMFKMYPRNQNQSLRKLAVERRRAKASGSWSIYVTLHWSTTLSETIEIIEIFLFRFLSWYLGFIAIQWIEITARIETLMDLF